MAQKQAAEEAGQRERQCETNSRHRIGSSLASTPVRGGGSQPAGTRGIIARIACACYSMVREKEVVRSMARLKVHKGERSQAYDTLLHLSPSGSVQDDAK